MALGSVLLDRSVRIRCIPAIAATYRQRTLVLPPWASILVQEAWMNLPEGWWEFMLRAVDAKDRLLPEGAFPASAPWAGLLASQPDLLADMCMNALPEMLKPYTAEPWLIRLSDGTWMLDPRIRAWARGYGLCHQTTGRPPDLALGGQPDRCIASILAGQVPEKGTMPDDWQARVEADINGSASLHDCPPASGDPVLDRLRIRWGGELPHPADGYPPWGSRSHPCADPFHWMAEGWRAFHANDLEGALRAFAWAHAHFVRLGSPMWASRAAANAAQGALYWGDLRAFVAWQAVEKERPGHFKDMDTAALLAMRTEWDEALIILHRLTRQHPDMEQAWVTILTGGMSLDRRSLVQEALPHVTSGFRELATAWLEDQLDPVPPDLDGELALIWHHYRSRRHPLDECTFWSRWRECTNAMLRLELGIARLAAHPREASAARLLDLQVIADRGDSPRHQDRLRSLWPALEPVCDTDPRRMIDAWLSWRTNPAWVIWMGGDGNPQVMGRGLEAPEGAISRLLRDGALAPFEYQGWIWCGTPLLWEGAPVGSVLLALAPEEKLHLSTGAGAPMDAILLAPWVAQLGLRQSPDPDVPHGMLLTDSSEPMATLLLELDRVAPSELPVLILGPSGSGKELAAREIHTRSGRSGQLVPVNCSALAESLLESELFGHVRGAFTGADRDRAGAIESAQGGTLFLDEIADISPRIQSMFLRVLQEREVRRVGSDRARKVDVRFLAATHKPLGDLIASGSFRRDLLFRLQGTVLRLPSLRERSHEFPYLLPRIVAQVASEARRHCPDLSPGLPQALSRLPWPGNFRELRHAIERALLRCSKGILKPEHFPELNMPELEEHTWLDATRGFQRRLLLEHLRRHRFHASETARSLGLTRPAMYLAAKRVGLDLIAERARWERENP